MAGFGFGNVGFLGSLGGGVVPVPVGALVSPYIGLSAGQSGTTSASAAFNSAFTFGAGVPWAISLIHRANAAGAHYVMDLVYGGLSISIIYGYNANTYELYIDGGGVIRVTGSAINPALAHKIDAVYDGTQILLSIDNVLVATRAGGLPAYTPGAGAFLKLETPPSPCELDSVRVTRNGVAIAEYLFAEASGLVAADTSGNGFNLTFNAVTHY